MGFRWHIHVNKYWLSTDEEIWFERFYQISEVRLQDYNPHHYWWDTPSPHEPQSILLNIERQERGDNMVHVFWPGAKCPYWLWCRLYILCVASQLHGFLGIHFGLLGVAVEKYNGSENRAIYHGNTVFILKQFNKIHFTNSNLYSKLSFLLRF